MVYLKSREIQFYIPEETDFFFPWQRPTLYILHLSSWPCHQRSLMSLHWRSLFVPCNSHLNAWSLFLSLFCTSSYLLKESIPFVSFCAFVLVFTEVGDKYHPHSFVRVLLSVVSSTTHTHTGMTFSCYYVPKVPSYCTCFQLDFHCCFLPPFIAVHAQELPTTEHTEPFQRCHPKRFALILWISSSFHQQTLLTFFFSFFLVRGGGFI